MEMKLSDAMESIPGPFQETAEQMLVPKKETKKLHFEDFSSKQALFLDHNWQTAKTVAKAIKFA